MKKIIAWAAAVCLVFALSACGTKPQAQGASTPPAGDNTTTAAGGAAAAELKLVAKNFEFDQKEYKVKKGQTVNVTLENKEGLHGVEIKGIKGVTLDNNKKTATFKADKEGSYDIICTVPCGSGHVNMKAKLIVEA